MGSCAGECTWREVTGRYQWMDIHEGCLITICICKNNTSTRTHAQEPCVMRAQRLNAVVLFFSSLLITLKVSSLLQLFNNDHEGLCVCVLPSPNPRRYAPASLFRLLMCPYLLISLSPWSHCSLLILSCPPPPPLFYHL